MQGRLVWAGFYGLAALLFHGVAAAQCTMDTECKGDRVCEAGKCTSPPAPAGPVGPAPSEPPLAAEPGVPPPAAASAPEPVTAPPPPAPVPPRVRQPARPAPAPILRDDPPPLRRNRPLMIAGIVMVSVGPLALLGAMAANSAQNDCDEDLERDYPDHMVPSSQGYRLERCDSYTVPLYVFGIGGAVLVAAGVPMIIYGGKTLPSKPARLQVTPWASRESGGLKLRLSL